MNKLKHIKLFEELTEASINVDLSDLLPGESDLIKQIISVKEKSWDSSYSIERIERNSDRWGDLDISGKSGSIRFEAWLPLSAISELTDWTSPKIANKTDYPGMARSGDWSGVRDTNRETIFDIFDEEFGHIEKLRKMTKA